MHLRRPLDKNKICGLCFQYPATVTPAKIYTRKELVMMEIYIADFHTSFYITAIQNFAFHLLHLHILSTNHYGNTRCEAFICHGKNKDVLCCSDYAEGVVDSFAHQIQYEYYGGNISVYIEGMNWSILVHQHIQKQKEHPKHAHAMPCFIIIFLMTANMILPQLLHTANTSLNC